MKKLKFITIIFLIALFIIKNANAETFRYYGPADSNTTSINLAAGNARNFDIVYNTETKIIRWVVNFTAYNGKLPNGMHMAFNDGPNPRGIDGELAAFYFDASTISQPKLVVYAYNGTDLASSWYDGSKVAGIQPADKILSSVAPAGSAKNPTGWIKQLIAVNEADGSRTLGFVIDLTKIQAHSPLYPAANIANAWKGALIGAKMGMWYHPLNGVAATYASDGFFTNITWAVSGWYDGSNTTTLKEDPICTYNFVSPTVKIGQLFQFIITGTDNQGNSLKIDYSGLPAGSTITPSTGSFGASPRSVNFSWTPQTSQAGITYTIGVIFTDPYGATASCPLTLTVQANKPPVCSASPDNIGYKNISCTGTKTSVKLDAGGTYDPELGKLGLTYGWTTNCPGGSFDNPNIITPTLTFNSENSNGTPVSCTATLYVTDGKDLVQCGAAINVNSCVKDCAGAINGKAVYDQCGKCNGDGKSCLDCKNVPFGQSKLDACGVCSGNGASCACVDKNIKELLFPLDISSRQQAAFAVRVAKRLALVAKGNKTVAALYTRVKKEANALYMKNWSRTWSIKQVIQTCPVNSVEVCASASNVSVLSAYNADAANIYNLTKLVLREVRKRKLEKSFGNIAQNESKAKSLYDVSLKASGEVPSSYLACN